MQSAAILGNDWESLRSKMFIVHRLHRQEDVKGEIIGVGDRETLIMNYPAMHVHVIFTLHV